MQNETYLVSSTICYVALMLTALNFIYVYNSSDGTANTTLSNSKSTEFRCRSYFTTETLRLVFFITKGEASVLLYYVL